MNPQLAFALNTSVNPVATWEHIYDTYSPYMYGVIYAIALEHTLSEDILKIAFLELKENLLALENQPSGFAGILKKTHELTLQQMDQMKLPVSQGKRELKLASLLCTPYSSIKDIALLYGITEEDAKKRLRREIIELRKNGTGESDTNANIHPKRIGDTLSINELLLKLQTMHYSPLRSV